MFNTNEFSYKNRKFTAEASDFKGRFQSMFKQIFDDACDEGFELKSARTGKVVEVILVETVRYDNEIQFWMFTPYCNDSFDSLIVFND